MKKEHKIISIFLILILSFISSILVYYKVPSRIENMVQDYVYQRPSVMPNNIKIIAIDEATLKELGPYSGWDRIYFANLINILNVSDDIKPTLIGLDILFSGTNNSESDMALVEAAKNHGNVVVASSIDFSNYVYMENDKYYSSKYVSNESGAFEELEAVTKRGFTNAIFDDDGVVRHTYTRIDSDGIYDSFAYTIASLVGNVQDMPSSVEIMYTGNPGDFETIPMSKVLDGSVPGSYFKDCIVLVGAYEEGMLDAYKVPIDYSSEMYGVEMQANYICAFLDNKLIYTVPALYQAILAFIVIGLYGCCAFNLRIKKSVPILLGTLVFYVAIVSLVFNYTSYKMTLIGIPFGLLFTFFVALVFKYVENQKKKALELQEMLFSMAEAFAEAIEGRTPYNANHTKNVAKRSVEMLDYINKLHKEKKSKLHFSESDKKQLYLAAMLHDVGKMDVPLEVMDKSTKLGARENSLRDRLSIISLKLKIDGYSGRITMEEADERISKIKAFLDKLGLYNCGKPLSEEEWAEVNAIAESEYLEEDGSKVSYLTQEEIDDIHIKAGTLSNEEREIMQSHVVYTDKILSHMEFGENFKDVRRMAANHHEVLNGKGYPLGLKEEDLDVMTRILTIMDIYDSLIADDRPYKKAKPINIAFKILDEEAEFGKVDKELLAIAKEMYLKDEDNAKDTNNK